MNLREASLRATILKWQAQVPAFHSQKPAHMARGRNFKRGGGAKPKPESDVNAKPEKEISVKGLVQQTPEGKSAMGGKKGGKRRIPFSKKGGAGKKGSIEPVKDFSGLIFMCNTETKKDCFKHHVFGLPEAKKDIVEKAKKGMKLFLFDIDQKVLYGVYKASSLGGMNLVSEAFQDSERKFPAQIRFRILKDCAPLDESEFKPVIKENYFGRNKFRCELSLEQVGKLMQLFRPLDAQGLPKPEAGKEAKGGPIQKGNSRGKPSLQKGSANQGPRTGASYGSSRSARFRQQPSAGWYPKSAQWEPLPTNMAALSQTSSFPGLVSYPDIPRLDADVLYRQRLDSMDRRAYALDPVLDMSLRHVGVASEYGRRRVPDEIYAVERSPYKPLTSVPWGY
ncbi:hypothetical protein L7F22_058209 [Adiantum nelumboides]|nr:hypothetical protein [Adiantum nelumboides]